MQTCNAAQQICLGLVQLSAFGKCPLQPSSKSREPMHAMLFIGEESTNWQHRQGRIEPDTWPDAMNEHHRPRIESC